MTLFPATNSVRVHPFGTFSTSISLSPTTNSVRELLLYWSLYWFLYWSLYWFLYRFLYWFLYWSLDWFLYWSLYCFLYWSLYWFLYWSVHTPYIFPTFRYPRREFFQSPWSVQAKTLRVVRRHASSLSTRGPQPFTISAISSLSYSFRGKARTAGWVWHCLYIIHVLRRSLLIGQRSR